MNKIPGFVFLLTALVLGGCSAAVSSEIFIRVNQVGFLPGDVKSAVVFSTTSLDGQTFKILSDQNKSVYSGKLPENAGKWGNFGFNYKIDFSSVRTAGTYYIEVLKTKSPKFKIANNAYKGVVDSLLKFLKVQRCGATNPVLHEVCHIYDSPTVLGDKSITKVDVTGGWHDAGDYIKFLSTTALTTYMLLFSYDFDSFKFGFDSNNDGVPDVLEEAKVGLDWMLRCNYAPGKLINQVGDLKDHTVGWRLPENDPLKFERPAISSIGKNQVGIYVAVMALAAKIWKQRFFDNEFSKRCLNAAENIYAVRNSVPDTDSAYTGMYAESNFNGRMALGLIELYNTTKGSQYLNEAISYGDKAGADYWWSWGDINGLVNFRLAQHMPRFKDYLYQNLNAFNLNKDSTIYGEATAFTWGTTNTLLGVALQSILWKKLNFSTAYDSLAAYQRDYVLGKNPWGVSFIYGIGSKTVRQLHHQVAYFRNGYLPGGISAGPAPRELLKNYTIMRTNTSLSRFNSEDVLFFDDKEDYLTNEPTIVTNATAIFVFGYLTN
ncbi:MAG: glycoside hydrolase family 9 protein [Ignavibacteriaceae bacterium]